MNLQSQDDAHSADALSSCKGSSSNASPTEGGGAKRKLRCAKANGGPFSCLTGTILGVSVCIFVFSLATFFAFDELRNMLVRHYTIITGPDSYLFDVWRNPATRGVSPLRKFTFFNLTNPDEMLRMGASPNYELLGPYVYEEVIEKFDIRFASDKNSVKYKYSSHYHFRPDLSKVDLGRYGPAAAYPNGDERTTQLSEDDMLLIPNMAIFGLRYRLGRVPGAMSFMPKQSLCDILSGFIDKTKTVAPTALFVKVRVKDLLWGYPDPLFTLAHPVLSMLQYYASTHLLTEWNGTYAVPSPYTDRSGQLCPLYHNFTGECNNTITLDTEELTGADDHANTGVLTQWAGQKQLWWWGPQLDGYTGGPAVVSNQPAVGMPAVGGEFPSPHADECPLNLGHSTNGMRWGPIDVISKEKRLPVFADFCFRPMEFDFLQESKVKGIPAWRFGLPASAMANTSFNRRCFQQERQGFFNFTQPVMGPVYAVKNWFLDAPFHDHEIEISFSVRTTDMNGSLVIERVPLRRYLEEYLSSTDARAFQERFDSYVEVEPLTGTTLRAVVQGMAMTPLGRIKIDGCNFDLGIDQNISDTLVPLVILERHVDVPDDLADELNLRLSQLTLVKVFIYLGVGFGAASIIAIVSYAFVLPRILAARARNAQLYRPKSMPEQESLIQAA